MVDFNKELNPSQLEAVTTTEGPVLVIAGAGTGKTRVVTYRTAYLLDQGVDPEHVLLLTFSVKAAREMQHRVEHMLNKTYHKLTVKNFHSFAMEMLKSYGRDVDVPEDFDILDSESASETIRQVMEELGLDVRSRGYVANRKHPTPKQIYEILSYSRNNRVHLDKLYQQRYPLYTIYTDLLHKIVIAYNALKDKLRHLDYDDLLFKLRLLLKTTSAGERLANRFRYVMVDEYQDTNLIQANIAALLSRKHHNIMGTGDPAQTLYTWRGAYVRNIYEFETRYKGTRVIKLEDNYRSYQQVLDLANDVMARAQTQVYKINLQAHRGTGGVKPVVVFMDDRAEQYTMVADRIAEAVEDGTSTNEVAVLSRSMKGLRRVEMELKIHNLPYVVFGGTRFSEIRHIKDLFALLKFGLNPRNVIAARRSLFMVDHVGPVAVRKLVREIRTKPGKHLLDILNNPGSLASRVAHPQLRALYAVLKNIRPSRDPQDVINEVFEQFYENVIETRFEKEDIMWRLGDIRQIVEIAGRYKKLRPFINDIMVEGASDQRNHASDENPIVLSTIHSAKGLEFGTVHLLDVINGWLPNVAAFGDDDAIEEERRALYVAITRAKNELFMYAPLTRDAQGQPRTISAFLRGLVGKVTSVDDLRGTSYQRYY